MHVKCLFSNELMPNKRQFNSRSSLLQNPYNLPTSPVTNKYHGDRIPDLWSWRKKWANFQDRHHFETSCCANNAPLTWTNGSRSVPSPANRANVQECPNQTHQATTFMPFWQCVGAHYHGAKWLVGSCPSVFEHALPIDTKITKNGKRTKKLHAFFRNVSELFLQPTI